MKPSGGPMRHGDVRSRESATWGLACGAMSAEDDTRRTDDARSSICSTPGSAGDLRKLVLKGGKEKLVAEHQHHMEGAVVRLQDPRPPSDHTTQQQTTPCTSREPNSEATLPVQNFPLPLIATRLKAVYVSSSSSPMLDV